MSPSRFTARARALLCLLTVAALASVATPFDRVLLKDGRVIDGQLLDSDDADYIVLRLPGADIPIPQAMVETTYVESLEDYIPKNKKEERELAKGNVLFEGRWMSKRRRDQMLRDRAEADKELIDQLRRDQKWQNHKTIETRHFVVKSNCREEIAQQAAQLIEDYYKAFVDFWNIKLSPSEGKEKMTFFFYRDTATFHEVTNTGGGLGGYFSPLERELHVPYNQQVPAEAWAVVLHEGNHLLTYLIDTGYRYPIWMNEGMAEYYGSAVIDDEGNFELGALQYGRIVSLRNDEATGNVLSLREVLLQPQQGFTARHYAVAWSFVHFLMESPEYGKAFKTFFKTLSRNRDVETENKRVNNAGMTWAFPNLETVITALERAMGRSLDELDEEWKEFTAQSYGELTPEAYYLAARIAKFNAQEGDEFVEQAMEYYGKACAMGIQDDECWRDYAEMLRKGGIDEGYWTSIVAEPDAVGAWDAIQKAIELDPIDAYNYTEAAGALILDSPVQDLDRALAMVQTADSLSPRSWGVQSLVDVLTALIEPARERRREAAEQAARLAEMDLREWMVQPAYIEGEEVPERIEQLSTDDVIELILVGEVEADDWIFQAYRLHDENGDPVPGVEKWDNEWTPVKDVPLFADALAEAAGG